MRKRQLTPLGERIKKLLAEMNKTQYQLAKEVGTTTSYLYLILIGERSGESYLPKIEETLGINLTKSA